MPVKTLITCDEFEALSQKYEFPTELVDGEIIELSPAGFPQAFLTMRIGRLLGNFVDVQKTGWVLGNEAGLHVNRRKQRTRGADVLYISYQRLPREKYHQGFLKVPPELVVEVFGEKETWDELAEKIKDYHEFGIDMVWVVDPDSQTVKLHPRGGQEKILSKDDTLDGGVVLPEFRVPLTELFAF